MISFCQYPYYALKRADEFLQLGKYIEATDCLYDFLKNKKNRLLINIHEIVMKQLLDICVEHKMSQLAKDALYLYRIICQGVNIKSWEDTINNFLWAVEGKVDSAKELSLTVKHDLKPFCEPLTPEMLLECVTNEDNQDRINRLVLFPWFKFSWECYRFCLDLLRNCQSEKFYHTIVQKAFKFCVRYTRKNELRKLCNLLRLHIGQLQKRQAQVSPNLFNPESQMLYLETGMVELESAIKLEDWQDAFKAAEDIHWALNMLKKPPHSRITSIYYEKLSFLFWEANDHLYHAAAVLRHFLLSREMKKNFTEEEMSLLSSRVVLAVLSVPFPFINPTVDLIAENDESVIEKKHRLLTMLLDLPSRPSRKTLVKDIENYNILKGAPVAISNVFRLLEYEVEPLTLGTSLTKNFEIIQETKKEFGLEKYTQSIYKVSLHILISQLSKLYTNISFSKLRSLAPPFEEFILEILVVDIARRYNFHLRLDHINQCIHFDSPLYLFQNVEHTNETGMLHSYGDKFLHLTQIHSSLSKAVKKLHPFEEFAKKMTDCEKLIEEYHTVERQVRTKMKERKKTIDRYKEKVDNIKTKKEEDEKKRAVTIQLKYEAAEKERLLRETEERDQQRRLREQDEMRKQILLEKMEILKKSEIGPLIEKYNLTDMDTLDPETLFCKHIEFINREKKGFLERLKRQARAIDHLERAKRSEELPLLQSKYEEEDKSHRLQWEENETERVTKACEHRKHLTHTKARLLVMRRDLEDFISNGKETQIAEYEKKMDDFSKLLDVERKKRLKERAEQRKAERRLAWLQEQSLQTKRRKDRKKLNQTSVASSFYVKRSGNKLIPARGNEEAAKSYLSERGHIKKDTPKYVEKGHHRFDNIEIDLPLTFLKKEDDKSLPTVKKPNTEYPQFQNFDDNNSRGKPSQTLHVLRRDNKDPITEKAFERDVTPTLNSKLHSFSSEQARYPSTYDENYKKGVSYSRSNDRSYARRSDRFNEPAILSWRQPRENSKYSIRDRQESTIATDFDPSRQTTGSRSKVDYNVDSRKELSTPNEDVPKDGFEKTKYNISHSCTPWAKLNRNKNV